MHLGKGCLTIVRIVLEIIMIMGLWNVIVNKCGEIGNSMRIRNPRKIELFQNAMKPQWGISNLWQVKLFQNAMKPR